MTPNTQLPPDDRALWDSLLGIFACPSVLVARDAGVFRSLAAKPLSLGELCEVTRLPRRPAEAVLNLLAACGLLRHQEELYSLTSVSEAYLLESSPTYFGGFLDMIAMAFKMYSYEGLKGVAHTDVPVVYDGADLFEVHAEQAQMAAAFTRAMHGMSIAPSAVWPRKENLAGVKTLLDVGGGSGAHSMAAAEAWPDLQASVLDLQPVCKVAQELIAQRGLASRVSTQSFNMWRDPLPQGDVHFYGSVFHDWPLERCAVLARKSFDSLPLGGRIMVHEMLLDGDKAGPQAVAAFSVSMLFGTQGQQYSAAEISSVLNGAGFTSVKVTPTFGYWSIVSGEKPAS